MWGKVKKAFKGGWNALKKGWEKLKGMGKAIWSAIKTLFGSFIIFLVWLLTLPCRIFQGRKKLNDREHALLKNVYRDGLNINKIRIVPKHACLIEVAAIAWEWSKEVGKMIIRHMFRQPETPTGATESETPEGTELRRPSLRPFTIGYTIYLEGVKTSESPETLVHESVHVWQYAHVGAGYITDSLVGQALRGQGTYDWRSVVDGGQSTWAELSVESQASLIEDTFLRGELMSNGVVEEFGNGCFFKADWVKKFGRLRLLKLSADDEGPWNDNDYDDYTELARSAVELLRG
ncbi:MAG: hypothetical protein HZC36_14285 [Armatimonadetes bacterium]|nr:hypothetical protein [Armatimonadota bacterium]